jgi:hypothetical protein
LPCPTVEKQQDQLIYEGDDLFSFGKITQFSIPESLLAILAVPKEMGTSSASSW